MVIAVNNMLGLLTLNKPACLSFKVNTRRVARKESWQDIHYMMSTSCMLLDAAIALENTMQWYKSSLACLWNIMLLLQSIGAACTKHSIWYKINWASSSWGLSHISLCQVCAAVHILDIFDTLAPMLGCHHWWCELAVQLTNRWLNCRMEMGDTPANGS